MTNEAYILEAQQNQPRTAEINGGRYIEDVRGRFVPEALYQAQVREVGTGVTMVNGREMMTDASDRLVPIDMVKPQHKLEDEVVRKVIGFAFDLSAQIGRFLEHTMIDLDGFDALLAQEYEVTKGGKKGNRTYQSYDGLYKVQVQIADRIDFGPELQVAKKLFDECMNEWSADSPAPLQAIVTRAFSTDKEGRINRADLFSLLRHDIEDERWQRAMGAIRDAMRVTGSKQYVRFYHRRSVEDRWQAITIDLAKAGA